MRRTKTAPGAVSGGGKLRLPCGDTIAVRVYVDTIQTVEPGSTIQTGQTWKEWCEEQKVAQGDFPSLSRRRDNSKRPPIVLT